MLTSFKCSIDGRTFKTARGLKNHIPKTHHIQVPWYEARYGQIVAEKENWNLEGFAKFWQDIDLYEAMRQKRLYIYGEPCDCGSSVCDECNPGWDQFDWRDEEPWNDDSPEDYY